MMKIKRQARQFSMGQLFTTLHCRLYLSLAFTLRL
jgi:hypothetical protein